MLAFGRVVLSFHCKLAPQLQGAEVGSRYGSLRVANDLRSKGIGGELATTTLAALKATEAERAQALWQQKFGDAPTDANERARQMRFLQARGFASDLIRKTVPVPRQSE